VFKRGLSELQIRILNHLVCAQLTELQGVQVATINFMTNQ